ncbi:MAG: T9SS type A sorting domain-containing protein [Thermoanaerobaculia bacterium]|nr:T9SS type A sorting domain-containing protein [Thermoanaerobaculia bacterium]
MKKILSFCIALVFCFSAGAQTTAANFIKTDCAGIHHNLFSELDSGYVVLLDFVMFDCSPCVTATNGLKTIHAQFEASHPGKVRFYSMGFLNYMSCPQMNNWKTEFGYTHTMFSGESSQVEYYGGMGMPTIVVLGGLSAHKVYYNHQGYSTAENTPIIHAINLAISESTTTGANQGLDNDRFQVFPNPFDDALTIILGQVQATHVILSDGSGREILRQALSPAAGNATLTLPAGHPEAGLYFISLFDGTRRIGMRKLVKQ